MCKGEQAKMGKMHTYRDAPCDWHGETPWSCVCGPCSVQRAVRSKSGEKALKAACNN